jgi:hypothetical protein
VDKWFLLLLAILTCYRLAMLVTQDDIFKPVRNYFGLHRWGWVRSWLGELTHCPYCFGVWAAVALALGWHGWSKEALLYWLAIAGGQAFMQKISDGMYGLEEAPPAIKEVVDN